MGMGTETGTGTFTGTGKKTVTETGKKTGTRTGTRTGTGTGKLYWQETCGRYGYDRQAGQTKLSVKNNTWAG
jgi:hypothetical protein